MIRTSLRRILSASLVLALGCSQGDSDDSVVAKKYQPNESDEAKIARILGFEYQGDWEPSAGLEGQSINRSEGAYSFAVAHAGPTVVESVELPALGPMQGQVSFDVFLAKEAEWGEVMLRLTSPTVGSTIPLQATSGGALSPLSAGQWHTFTFDLPSKYLAPPADTATDIVLKVEIDGPENVYYLDNFDLNRTNDPGGDGDGDGDSGGGGGSETPTNADILGFEAITHGTRGDFDDAPFGQFGSLANPNIAYTQFTNAAGLSDPELDALSLREGSDALVVSLTADDPPRYSFVTPQLSDLQTVSNTLELDIKIPHQSFGSQFGVLRISAQSADAGITDQLIGEAPLDGSLLYMNDFGRVRFPIPEAITDALDLGSYDDLQFRIDLVDVAPGNYVFDRLAFGETLPPVIPPAPSLEIDDTLSFESAAAWQHSGSAGLVATLSHEASNGQQALCGHGYTEWSLRSRNLSTLGTTNGVLDVEVRRPTDLAANETLTVSAFVNIPSQGVNQASLGTVELTGAYTGGPVFEEVSFPLGAALQSTIESAVYGDLSFEFAFELPRATTSAHPTCLDDIELGHDRFAYIGTTGLQRRHIQIDVPSEMTGVSVPGDIALYVSRDVPVAYINDNSRIHLAGSPTTNAPAVAWKSLITENNFNLDWSYLGDLFAGEYLYIKAGTKAGKVWSGGWFHRNLFNTFDLQATFAPIHHATFGHTFETVRPASSAESVTVVDGQTRTLEPGAYEKIIVESGATLDLDPGAYTVRRNFTVKDGGIINLNNDEGDVRVFLHRHLNIHGEVLHATATNNVTWVQVPARAGDDQVLQARITGKFYGSLYGGFVTMTGEQNGSSTDWAIHRGTIVATQGFEMTHAKLRLDSPDASDRGCDNCGYNLGCTDAAALDGLDGDGISVCEELADNTGWTTPGDFNGLNLKVHDVAFIPAGPVEWLIDGTSFGSLLHEGNQSAGWSQPDRFDQDHNEAVSPGIPGAAFTVFGERILEWTGYLFKENRGHHCFALDSAPGAATSVIFVDDQVVTTTDDQGAASCLYLLAGAHSFRYVTIGNAGVEQDIFHCYGGAAECTPREAPTAALFRPAYDPINDIVECDDDNRTCSEHCPCDDTWCDDGNACTTDICNFPAPGLELHLPVDVDDGDLCTDDSCDPISGVTHEEPPTGTPCSYYECEVDNGARVLTEHSVESPAIADDDACTIEYCDENFQVQSEAIAVGDNPCLTLAPGSTCDPSTGVLGNIIYSDGADCGGGRTCSEGLCLRPGEEAWVPGTVDVTVADLAAELSTNAFSGCTVAPIDPEHVAIIRGTVGKVDGGVTTAFPGARVSVLNGCEFGYVNPDSVGNFALPIAGGGKRVIRIEDPAGNYFPADREVTTEWGTGDFTGPVILLKKSDAHTEPFDANNRTFAGPVFTAIDENGQEVTVGTAGIHIPDGTTFGPGNATSGSIHIAPFTTGVSGPQRMPAALPPGTEYTHAFEISTNDGSQPNSPIIYYFDNFRGGDCQEEPESPPEYEMVRAFDGSVATGTGTCADYEPGEIVPHFAYNETTGQWERKEGGEIVQLDCVGGEVVGFVAGASMQPDADELVGLNQFVQDGVYSCANDEGEELWRVEMDHFSAHDLNWYFQQIGLSLRMGDFGVLWGMLGQADTECGSIIDVEDKVLREEIRLPGTSQSLHYNSDAMFGFEKSRTFPVPFFTGAALGPLYWSVPGIAKWDGEAHGWPTFGDPTRGNPYAGDEDSWSGRDIAGRRMYGSFPAQRGRYAEIIVGWSPSVGNIPMTLGPFTLGTYAHVHDAVTRGLGGWTLSGHHALHTVGHTLYRGDTGMTQGTQRFNVESVYSPSELAPGDERNSSYFFDLEVTRSGGVYFARDVTQSTHLMYYGPEVSAPVPVAAGFYFGKSDTFALDPFTERLFIADYDGGQVLATPASPDWTANPLPAPVPLALDLGDRQPSAVVVLGDGTVVVAVTNPERIQPAPELEFEAFELVFEEDGSAHLAEEPLFGWEGKIITDHSDRMLMKRVPNEPRALVMSSEFIDGSYRIFRWSQGEGIAPLLWEGCGTSESLDSRPAGEIGTDEEIKGLLPLKDGRVLYSLGGNQADNRVYQLVPSAGDQEITCPGQSPPSEGAGIPYISKLWAGVPGGTGCGTYTLHPSGAAGLSCLGKYGTGLALGPDGQVWASMGKQEPYSPTVVRFGKPSTDGTIEIVSESGAELFIFDSDGRHRETRDALDPSVVYRSFEYEDDDEEATNPTQQLVAMTEQGRRTEIERFGDTITIVSPFGHETVITTNSRTGYATSIQRNPIDPGGGGEAPIVVAHNANGLLRSMTDDDGTHVYEYSEYGELELDSLDGVGQTLAERRAFLKSYTAHISGEGEESRYHYERDQDQSRRWVENADGTGYELVTDNTNATTVTTSNGMVTTTEWGTHAESGALVASKVTINVPEGPSMTTEFSSTALGETGSNLVTETVTVGGEETVTVTDVGSHTRTTTSPMGRTVSSGYDEYGRTLWVQVGDLEPRRFEYFDDTDPEQSALERITVDGQATPLATYQYNTSTGYVSTIATPDGNTTLQSDGYGRPTSSTTSGLTTSMSYDWDGRLSGVTEPRSVSDTHAQTYTAAGLMASYQPPSAEPGDEFDQLRWEYDNDRRVKNVHYPIAAGEEKTIEFVRDAADSASAGRVRTTILHDNLLGDESIEIVYGDEVFAPLEEGEEEQAPLGRPGQIHSVRRGDLKSEYSWKGSLPVREELVSGAPGMTPAGITLSYDNQLRPDARGLLVAGQDAGSAVYGYNDDGQVKTINAGAETLTYTYDGEDRFDGTPEAAGDNRQHGMLEGVDFAGGLSEVFTHDDNGRLLTHAVTDGANAVYNYAVLDRDDLGRVTEETVLRHGASVETVKYTYDGLGQLKTTERSIGATVLRLTENEYDANGNKTCTELDGFCSEEAEFEVGEDNRISSFGGNNYTYDKAGRLASTGNVAEGYTDYQYDLLGSLKTVTTTDGWGSPEQTVRYENDHAGRRVGREVLNSGGYLIERRQYVWANALQIEAELDADGDVVSRFVYGQRVNVPELVIRPNADTGIDDVYRVITDVRGSPILVVKANGGNPGAPDVLLEASYDEWGNPTLIDSAVQFGGQDVWPIPHGFAGGLYDETTGLVRFGARDYEARAGRWTAGDPILFHGLQSNLYQYVGNDPIQRIDPEGELFFLIPIAAWTAADYFAAAATTIVIQQVWTHSGAPEYLASKASSLWDSLANIAKGDSPVWNALDPYRGKTRQSGRGSKRRFYEWDYTHNDIEVYDNQRKHLGTMDPETGEMCKPKVKGRTIKK